MAKKTGANAMYKTDRVVSSREKVFNVIVFILLLLLAVVMVFPLVYMVLTSFMTKNQILSGRLTLIPNPVLIGKYSEVLSKGQFINGILNTVKVEIPVLLVGGSVKRRRRYFFCSEPEQGSLPVCPGRVAGDIEGEAQRVH